ncbi:MAG: phosphatase PAP2 family protein [Mariprofundaceae bacterium]
MSEAARAVVAVPDRGSFDHALFRLINDAHTPWLDGVFGVVSGLGDGLVVALLCAVAMLFRLRDGLAMLAAFVVSGLAAQALKRLFDAPRPPVVLDHVHVLGAKLTAHSFPSGHATSDGVMIAAVFLLWGARDIRAWLAAALFFLAAVGRIYGGVHFPIDVAAGLLLGVAVTIGVWRLSRRWALDRWRASAWARMGPALLVLVLASVLGLGYRMQPVTAQPLAAVLPVLALGLVFWRWRHDGARHGD